MAITKYPDWLDRLTAFLVGRRKQPFAWGSHDCALFVCDGILAMTGTDLAAAFRGRYSDGGGAMSAIQAAGHEDLEQLAESITAAAGMTEVPLENAQRGDVLLWHQSDGGATLGLVSTDGLHGLFAGPNGLMRQRVRKCDRSWRIN